MGFLAAAIPAVASLAGSFIGANAQKSAARDAANAQFELQDRTHQQQLQAEADYRAQIMKMIPYLQGPSQTASAVHGQQNYLAPGQNQAMFGGQTLGQNGSMYMPSMMPPSLNSGPNSNYLAQGFSQGASGVPRYTPETPPGLNSFPGISGGGGELTLLPARHPQVQSNQRLPGIGG